jgi:glycosyltransferase involved in cell wall biosynthesis
MAPAALMGNPSKPVVLDLTDCLTAYTKQLANQPGAPFLRRMAAKWDHWLLRKEEVEWVSKVTQATIISPLDRDVLVTNGQAEDKIAVVPNGVDLAALKVRSVKNVYPSKIPVVCFVGNMGYAPNEEGALWFIRTVWPLVKAKVPHAIFAAVGGTPRRALQRFHNGKDILVTGWVPDIEPYLLNAKVSIAPLRFAGGMQNKVALSMGLGIPVVATTASTGWLSESGKKLIAIADDHERFAQEIIHILKKPASIKAQVLKGKRFITQNYSWDKAGKQFETVLKKAGGKK